MGLCGERKNNVKKLYVKELYGERGVNVERGYEKGIECQER
jgi:hypothetical protein